MRKKKRRKSKKKDKSQLADGDEGHLDVPETPGVANGEGRIKKSSIEEMPIIRLDDLPSDRKVNRSS